MSRRENPATTVSLLVVIGSYFSLGPALAQIPVIEPLQVIEASEADQTRQAFAHTVALDGDMALVGLSGQVGVYTRDAAGVWQRTDTLVRPTSAPIPNDSFGLAVALDDNVALISSDTPFSGPRVHVFRRANGDWAQTQVLDAGDGICLLPEFAIENGVIAATATSSAGKHVFIFIEDEFGKFQVSTSILPPRPADFRVALNETGQWLLVGDPVVTRAVYVYRAVESIWTAHQTLTPSDGAPESFGDSITIDEGAIVIGARFAPAPSIEDSGAAYVFLRDGDFWYETRTLQLERDEQFAGGNLFGSRVALNDRFVMVSMPDPGVMFLYDRSGNFDAPDFAFVGGPEGRFFGQALDVSESTVLVGSPTQLTGPQGAAYVYSTDEIAPASEAAGSSLDRQGTGGRGGAIDPLQILLLAMLVARRLSRLRPRDRARFE